MHANKLVLVLTLFLKILVSLVFEGDTEHWVGR